jgi:hypothetical protein
MNFKKIQFDSNDAQKIYENYLKQIKSATKKLSSDDQNDILMELNSHIYESSIKKEHSSNEVTNLIAVLDKIGTPSEILLPLVAEKKLNQATKTFNPVHVFQALALNISNGIIYIIFFFLYLFLIVFLGLIPAKLIYPDNVGLYYKKDVMFEFGAVFNHDQNRPYEILGNWFIPTIILIVILFYFLITLMLKLKRSLNKTKISI